MRETKRTRRERECGLGFAWQLPESSTWALFCAVAITGALAVALFGGLRVRVVPPPRVIERKAEAVMIPADAEGRNWEILAQEAGPFPTRFEPASWPAMRALDPGRELGPGPGSRPGSSAGRSFTSGRPSRRS